MNIKQNKTIGETMNTQRSISLRSAARCALRRTQTLALLAGLSVPLAGPAVVISEPLYNGQCYESSEVGLSFNCSLAPITIVGTTTGYTCAGGPCTYSSPSTTTYTCTSCSFLESVCNCVVKTATVPVTILAGSCSGKIIAYFQDQTDCKCVWNGITPGATPVSVGTLYGSNQEACWD